MVSLSLVPAVQWWQLSAIAFPVINTQTCGIARCMTSSGDRLHHVVAIRHVWKWITAFWQHYHNRYGLAFNSTSMAATDTSDSTPMAATDTFDSTPMAATDTSDSTSDSTSMAAKDISDSTHMAATHLTVHPWQLLTHLTVHPWQLQTYLTVYPWQPCTCIWVHPWQLWTHIKQYINGSCGHVCKDSTFPTGMNRTQTVYSRVRTGLSTFMAGMDMSQTMCLWYIQVASDNTLTAGMDMPHTASWQVQICLRQHIKILTGKNMPLYIHDRYGHARQHIHSRYGHVSVHLQQVWTCQTTHS